MDSTICKCRCFLCDYARCDGEKELQKIIDRINTQGYTLVSVTQYEHTYTVFFRRPVYG